MNKQHVDVFLGITLALVVTAGALILAGWAEYEIDRDNHRQSQHKGSDDG
jgi:hypothetical protein